MAADNSAIPVVSYKISGDYGINSPIDWKDFVDISRRVAIIIASKFFHARNRYPYHLPIPESRDKSFEDFLGYVANSIFEHLTEPDYGYAYTLRTQHDFFKSLSSERYILDEEQAYNWMGDKPFNFQQRCDTSFTSMSMVTSSPPFSEVTVWYDVWISNVSVGRQQPQNPFTLNRQVVPRVVPKPHDFWAELIRNVNKAHGKYKQHFFEEYIADKVILMSAGYRNIAYLPHVKEMLHHSYYQFFP